MRILSRIVFPIVRLSVAGEGLGERVAEEAGDEGEPGEGERPGKRPEESGEAVSGDCSCESSKWYCWMD